MPIIAGAEHLRRDLRRSEGGAVACSTAAAAEEPPLAASSTLRALGRRLSSRAPTVTDGEASVTAESALSAEADSVDELPALLMWPAPAAAHIMCPETCLALRRATVVPRRRSRSCLGARRAARRRRRRRGRPRSTCAR